MADADCNHAIVKGCRRQEPAMDFLSANEQNSREFLIRMFLRSLRAKIESWPDMIARPCRGISPSL